MNPKTFLSYYKEHESGKYDQLVKILSNDDIDQKWFLEAFAGKNILKRIYWVKSKNEAKDIRQKFFKRFYAATKALIQEIKQDGTSPG